MVLCRDGGDVGRGGDGMRGDVKAAEEGTLHLWWSHAPGTHRSDGQQRQWHGDGDGDGDGCTERGGLSWPKGLGTTVTDDG